MKILELQLQAFASFTDLTLDLREGNQGMHILFGPNEAGKSSALRALHSLLYGIPHNSTDNFIHDNNKLRIGGCIRHSDGSEITFLRRKGNKNTLLGIDGKPLVDSNLEKYLQGVEETLFLNLFGIDHEALVRGGQDILQGGGDIGESLFGASLGGASLRKVLLELDNEADGLFRPQGQRPLINRSIGEYNEAKRKIREFSLSSREWSECNENLRVSLKERDQLQQELNRLASQKNHLERLQKALPKIARRLDLIERLKDIGEVVVLPSEFTAERREVVQKLRITQDTYRRTQSELEKLNQDREGLTVPESLLVQAGNVTKLHQRLGSHRKAAQDLAKLQGNFQQLIADARVLLSELRLEIDMEEARLLRPGIALKTRIQQLGSQFQTKANDLNRAKRDVQKTERELAEALDEMASLDSAVDTGPLKRSLGRLLKQGNLTAERERLLLQIKSEEEQVRIDLKKLPLWQGSIEELEGVPTPTPETIDRFESIFQDLTAQQSELEGRIDEVDNELEELARKMEELRLAGAVPTEDELTLARERRDQGWRLVYEAWISKVDVSEDAKAYDPHNELPEAYEKSVTYADQLADRLRREANRVAENATLIAYRVKHQDDLRKMKENLADVQRRIGQNQQEWVTIWQKAGIVPLPPKEIRSWIVKQNALVQKARSLRDYQLSSRQLNRQIEEYRQELLECLEHLGEKGTALEKTLDALADFSQTVVERIEEENRLRKELHTKIAKSRRDLVNFQSLQAECARQLEEWEKTWIEVMSEVGLSEKTLPAEADAFMIKFEDFFKKIDEADGLNRRIYGIERDAAEFREAVRALVQQVAPGLDGMPEEQAADQLYTRLIEAQKASVEQAALEKQLKEKKAVLAETEETVKALNEQLDALCRRARCSKYEELEEIEKRSSEFQVLQGEISGLEEQLLELGGGAALEDLLKEAATVDADSLPMQIDEKSHLVGEFQTKRSQIDENIGAWRLKLQQMDGSARAAEEAGRAKEIEAGIRLDVERYIRLRMSSSILRKEIESYRKKNQGRLLSRASQLFCTMTLGSFSGLETDFNEKDEPVLVGIRPSGELIRVQGMSDGTCDQLYLSLRLASLEKYLETNEEMPFIVDDILIRFDDERAAATLRILSELSLKTQILFFTHHSRLAELAKEVCSEGSIIIHQFV